MFALFPIIVVGPVKATGFVSIGGVDTTALSVGFLLAVTAIAFLRNPGYPVQLMIPFFVFALVVLLGVARSDLGEYQSLKARDFFLLTGVVVSCIPILLRDLRDLRGMLFVWFSGGVLVATLVLIVGGAEDLYGRAGIGESTLGPAYLSAAALVVGGASLGERLLPGAVALPGMAVSAIALVTIGSRGPILAAAIGLLAWVLLKGLLRARSLLVLALATTAALVGVRQASEAALSRLVLEDPAREELWAIARAAFLEAPILGVGWGNYSGRSWIDVYPHNLFLEVGSELGLLGLVSLVVLLAAVVVRVWQRRPVAEVRVAGALAVVMMVGQQFSSDLTNRLFWIALIPCLLLPVLSGKRGAASLRE